MNPSEQNRCMNCYLALWDNAYLIPLHGNKSHSLCNICAYRYAKQYVKMLTIKRMP
jgi:hypothetical protein